MDSKYLPEAQVTYPSLDAVNVEVVESSAPAATTERWPPINEASARQYLSEHRWPIGLQESMIKNLSKIPVRYFICDDSGSMAANDGHRLMSLGNSKKFISSTRWAEMADALRFHAGLARAANATSEFRFLNGATVAIGGYSPPDNIEFLRGILDGSPGGGTPLCRHIREVVQQITEIAPSLRASGQKVSITILTDGESSDGDVAAAMRPLQNLPVWVVIRLCTDEEKIVNYWNNIDNDLELEMDVLDDLQGEAEEVTGKNRWLTYGEPLHRLREFGVALKELDLLDEATLSKDQILRVCASILGGKPDDYPHPEVNFKSFIAYVDAANAKSAKAFCPKTLRVKPWIDTSILKSESGGCIVS